MKRSVLIINHVLSICLASVSAEGQSRLLGNEGMMRQAEKGLEEMYNYEFSAAGQTVGVLEENLPEHPVVPFMKALIIYWENMPLVPHHPASVEFQRLLEQSMKHARVFTRNDPGDIEGVFFDLAAQAMMMMYYADNGLSVKVIPYLSPSYRLLKKGFLLGDELVEFCFTTGLYNYYIDAYPEMYPVYKPVAALFPAGDRTTGLSLLRRVSRESVFLKTEALVFLNHLYLSYENNPSLALDPIRKLCQDHPNNSVFLGKLVNTLLVNDLSDEAETHVRELFRRGEEDQYASMLACIFQGVILEKKYREYGHAKASYKKGIGFEDVFGVYVYSSTALAFAGLSRISFLEGKQKAGREYLRKAKARSAYEYIYR